MQPLKKLKTYSHILWATLILLFTNGCANLNVDDILKAADVRTPDVSIKQSNIKNFSFEHVDLELTLNIDNPNFIPIDVAGLDYSLAIDGKSLLSGQQSQGIKIGAQQTSDIVVPITLKFADIKKIVSNFLNKDQFDYEFTSNVLMQLPIIGAKTLTVSKADTLPVPKTPKVSLSNIKVDQLGLTSAKLIVDMNIDNPNAFGVNLQDFIYNVNINGSQWAKGKIDSQQQIAKKGQTTLSLPIDLNLFEMGRSVYNMIVSKEPLQYQLSGNMDLGTSLPLLQALNLPIHNQGQIAWK